MKTHFFIHIPKNGGTALRLFPFLQNKVQDATPNWHISPEYTKGLHSRMKELGDHHGNEHARLRDINQDKIKDMKKFAIIRNPWDRVASRYWFAKQLIEIQQKVHPSYADVSSFDGFLEERWKWGNLPYMWHRAVRGWSPALDYVVDDSGKIGCDLLRFEEYNKDIQNYFGISLDVPKRNVTTGTENYKSFYSPLQIQIVADWYKTDIETFGFDFDTSATKNMWCHNDLG